MLQENNENNALKYAKKTGTDPGQVSDNVVTKTDGHLPPCVANES